MKAQQRATTEAAVANTEATQQLGEMQGLLDAACASLVKMKKSSIAMYEGLHRFYVHFATNPDVETHVPGTDWRCASFEQVCDREGFDVRKSVRKMRTMLVERIFARIVLEEATSDDAGAPTTMRLSAYECFAATIDARTQGADWAAWPWPALDAWMRHDDQRDLREAMAKTWETAKRRATMVGCYCISSRDLVEAWRDHLPARQPAPTLSPVPTKSC
ncbi:hypothetical protein psal_cds_1183 [Pandoravirus salinus]|uniref:Uncharacterized protein n=1 Tax=Pandoravirus salinus TaxID=1349410 RepID=S4W570_9VIRU|nr:hypothetical protein psal_cds_1183 [Pandoravirus salinus]AGO85465.1 hypothetical protein psal_cds_1183 [Pandoravirus salinus]